MQSQPRASESAAWSHPLPQHVPALRDVAAALRRVSRAPEPGPGFRVGICDAAGRVLAGASVPSFNQVQRFSLALAELGYGEVIAGEPAQMQGCHVLFVQQ